MKFVVKLLAVAIALLLVQQYVPGISVSSFTTAVFVAIALALINLIVRPILVIFTLPITIISLGLFLFVLNALLFWGTSLLVPGFTVYGFVPALIGSLVVSAVHFIVDHLFS